MEYRLEELFDLQMGKTPSRSVTEYWESGNNKWISIADLSKCGKYIYDTKECLSDIAVPESDCYLLPDSLTDMSVILSPNNITPSTLASPVSYVTASAF